MRYFSIIRLLLGVTLLLMLAGIQTISAEAQEFPARAITIVVPFPAGGSADSLARAVGSKLSTLTGQTVVIENKPGGAGVIGANAVISAPRDGYTIILNSTPSAFVGPNITAPRPFDPAKEFVPVTAVARAPAVLVIHPKYNIKTFKDFVDYAKAHPGKINIVSAGVGTGGHFNIEFLRRETGVNVVHVPYRGSPQAMADLVGGHVDAFFSDASFFLGQIKSGAVVPLVTAAPRRIPALPDVPTSAEQGYPKLLNDNIYWVFVTAGTPRQIIDKLNALIIAALRTPEVKAAFDQQSVVISTGSPDEAAASYSAENERWLPLIRQFIPVMGGKN